MISKDAYYAIESTLSSPKEKITVEPLSPVVNIEDLPAEDINGSARHPIVLRSSVGDNIYYVAYARQMHDQLLSVLVCPYINIEDSSIIKQLGGPIEQVEEGIDVEGSRYIELAQPTFVHVWKGICPKSISYNTPLWVEEDKNVE